MRTVAVVEDDAVMARLLEEICRTSGYAIVGSAYDARSAVAMIDHNCPDYLLLGFDLGAEGNGLDLIERVKDRHPAMFTIMITAWDINDIASRIHEAQPDRILRKPVHAETLITVMARAEERQRRDLRARPDGRTTTADRQSAAC